MDIDTSILDEPGELQEDEPPEDAERKATLFALADSLLRLRDEAVRHRSSSGVEQRWLEDESMFEGPDTMGRNDMLDYATGTAYRRDPHEARRSRVVVNIVRGKCEVAEGRFSDILLPVDDKNWGLRVTPVPQIAEQMQDDRPAMQAGMPVTDAKGNQAKVSDVAKDIKAKAEKAMSLMEAEIEDQLVECDYTGECRKVIRQAVRLGTGVLKGPLVVKSVAQQWSRGGGKWALSMQERLTPSSCWVDAWNVYPSPGTKENIAKTCEYIWEKDEILPRDIGRLVGVEGYEEDQLMLVLQEDPRRTRVSVDKGNRTVVNESARRGSSYEKWEYHGMLDLETLAILGCECPSDPFANQMMACVVFINDHPVKVALNHLDAGGIPYDFFQWTTTDSNSPWGIGVPRQMVWLQRIITSAWRAMMDNAGDSAGPLVAMSRFLEPADGQWEIGGKKLYIAKEEIEDVSKALVQFQLNSNQVDLQNIIELALRFVDLETSMPTIFQGEVQEVPETLGATNIMLDSSNISIRHRAKLFDDRITDPHITRYYHHNMTYSDKEEIKGDFQVDARGTSVLMERDQQAQTLLQVFGLKADPDVSRATNWEKAIRQFYRSKRLDIMKTDDELAQHDEAAKNQQPGNPQMEVAKVRVQGELEKETMRQESDMAELQYKAKEAENQRLHDKAMKEMDLQIKMMEYAQQRNINLDKLKAQLAISSAGMNLQEKLRKSTPQVAPPPTEPAGKAPVGQAYER